LGSGSAMTDRIEHLKRLLGERIVLLDGSWGVLIQRDVRGEAAYRGDRFAGLLGAARGNEPDRPEPGRGRPRGQQRRDGAEQRRGRPEAPPHRTTASKRRATRLPTLSRARTAIV